MLAALRAVPARSLIFAIEFYRRWVSPMLLPSCRFTPTCSAYAVEAVRDRGAVVGTGLSVVRVLKCAPWHSGGWDPVPPGRRARVAPGHRSDGQEE